eukprot:scaffold50171_cov109-Phaeocystis_antarctica.AAC.1
MFDVAVSLYVEGVREVSCMFLPRPTECGTWPTNMLARLETPTSSSSPAASLFLLAMIPARTCST